jgi:hypothetical protein
MCGAKSL